MEKCNSQFSMFGHKCERVKGHEGCCATREALGIHGSGAVTSMTPQMASLISWAPWASAAQPQPAPQRNLDQPAVTDLVLTDFRARDAFGAKKYGTRLQPHNGRDALQDAYQEALDLCCYLRQAIYERDGK